MKTQFIGSLEDHVSYCILPFLDGFGMFWVLFQNSKFYWSLAGHETVQYFQSKHFLDIDPRSSQHNGWDHPQVIVEIDVIVIIQVTNLLWCFGKSQVLQNLQ